MHILKNTKGISLPMVIGLVSLLMVASVAANEMIIRTLRSVHRIEAADRAYFAAEAGIEDALYELTPHFAGYQTPLVGSDNERNADFGSTLPWTNEWVIKAHDTDTDPNTINGEIYEGQKLVLALFNDTGSSTTSTTNAIDETASVIEKLDITDGSVRFSIPEYIWSGNTAFATTLIIDNDGDLLDNGYNEDGEVGFSDPGGTPYGDDITCSGIVPGEDDDCDERENEDSFEDPVIYWKVLDDQGNSLTPRAGCIVDGGSEICEKDFVNTSAPRYSVSITPSTVGIDQDGNDDDFANFIINQCGDKCQMEFTIVAPLEHVDTGTFTKIDIPYLEYELNVTSSDTAPLPYFSIESDGYYKDFKQSITTTVYPKTAVPLFDFTIIQQQ
jgi:hypothetical protein